MSTRCQPSFEQIFNKYRSWLIFYAVKLVRDQLVAEDIVTEVFLKFWQNEKGFPNAAAAKAFLDISTRNACLNYLETARRNKRREKIIQRNTEEFEDSVLNAMTRAELISEGWNIIESLPVECRRVILLCYVKNMSNLKTAQHLGLSVHTIKNQKREVWDLLGKGIRSWKMITNANLKPNQNWIISTKKNQRMFELP